MRREDLEWMMTDAELDVLMALRSRGYAITVWTPAELRGADSEVIEDLMVERGSEAISQLATEEDAA